MAEQHTFAAAVHREAAREAPGVAPAPTTAPRRVRHKKRGSHYDVVGQGEVQASTGPLAEGEPVTVYRGEDGRMWVRRTVEFEDGRFEDESALDELSRLGQEMGDYD